MGADRSAAECFRRALQLAQVGPEQAYLAQILDQVDSG
jgi:hypothetical protein